MNEASLTGKPSGTMRRKRPLENQRAQWHWEENGSRWRTSGHSGTGEENGRSWRTSGHSGTGEETAGARLGSAEADVGDDLFAHGGIQLLYQFLAAHAEVGT